MKDQLAQKLIISLPADPATGVRPIELTGPLKGGINKLSDVVSIFISFVYPLAAVLLFIYLVWGGFDYMLSKGDPEKIKSGKAKITAAIIGFFLLMMSFFIIKIFTYILGFDSGIFG